MNTALILSPGEHSFLERRVVPFASPYPPFNEGEWEFEEYGEPIPFEPDYTSLVYRLVWRNVHRRVKLTSVPMLHLRMASKSVLSREAGNVNSFPASNSGNIDIVRGPWKIGRPTPVFSLEVSFSNSSVFRSAPPMSSSAERSLARVHNAVTQLHSQDINDVQFYFPREKRQLWSNVQFLSKASPYFKVLFEAGFAETSEQASSATATEAEDAGYEDDSDGETILDDNPTYKTRSKECRQNHPFRKVTIRETSFVTYQAVLAWVHVGHIAFAPLRSTFPDFLNREKDSPRKDAIVKIVAQDPLLPHPSSPKSVYRLAHYLELDDLQKLALQSIQQQLTVKNVAHELFSGISLRYPNVQKIALEYAIQNWKSVKDSQAMKVIEQQMDAGELNSAAGLICLKLARGL